MSASPGRWAWADIDLGAVEHNVHVLRSVAAPATVWAVVKADGYGHGAVDVATAALRAGAEGLCVALAPEGVELRDAGIDKPILLLSEQPISQLGTIIEHRLTPTVTTPAFLAALAEQDLDGYPVHVKIDTGMQRVGVAVDEAVDLIRSVAATPGVRLEGVYTHLACADEPASPATDRQLASFDDVLRELDAAGVRPELVHAANSAATLAVPAARRSIVRAGIAVYGIAPGPELAHLTGELRPAMSLRARVSHVKPVAAGSHVSYGWRHRFDSDTTVATVPLGYADGVPRRLGSIPGHSGADVLIGGARCPIVGVVTMDQLMVDVGAIGDVAVGDEVVLIGEQGGHQILVDEWAERLGTIGYEIVCGISRRMPRVVHRPG